MLKQEAFKNICTNIQRNLYAYDVCCCCVHIVFAVVVMPALLLLLLLCVCVCVYVSEHILSIGHISNEKD